MVVASGVEVCVQIHGDSASTDDLPQFEEHATWPAIP
jgi:hypothetical protein